MSKILNEKKWYIIILILSIISISTSILIQIEKVQYNNNINGICSVITGYSGCQTVQTSEYSKTFGIDNPIYGIIGFSILALSTIAYLKTRKKIFRNIIIIGSIIASSIALWFIYLQTFVIGKYCIFCMIVDIISIILAIISITLLIYSKNTHK